LHARYVWPVVLSALLGCGGSASDGAKVSSGNSAKAASDAGAPPDAEGGALQVAPRVGAACTADGDCPGGVCAFTLAIGPTTLGAPGGYCTAACQTRSDCVAGNACTNAAFGLPGHCSSGCEGDSDCRAGYRCVPLGGAADGGGHDADAVVTGTCEPVPKTDKLADGVVGSACKGDGDCPGGRCGMTEPITGTPFPGGYCTGDCLVDADCGVRGYCSPGFLGAVPGTCSLRCANDADCGRDDYRCRSSSGADFCVPGPKPLPDHVVGNPCAADADCGGGAMTCAATVGGGPAAGGYCSESCSVDADCGAGGICINGIMSVLATGICYATCVPPSGCRDGYTCESLSGSSTDTHGVCAATRPDGGGAPDAAE